jgi:hypothetical protein
MSNEFLITYVLILAGVGIYGLVLYLLAMREQRRFFAEHPEYPSPFEVRRPGHTPAE